MPFIKKKKICELSKKELDAIKIYAKEFLLKDIESVKSFVKKIKDDFGQDDLLFALKMFVLSSNKVFNQAEYMKHQTKHADEYIKSKDKNLTQEQRRAALNLWIEENAENFRKQAIFYQIEKLESIREYILSEIEKELEK